MVRRVDMKSNSHAPGYRIGMNKVAIYGSYHWFLGRIAWDEFVYELYRPKPIYETQNNIPVVIGYDNGPHLAVTFTYDQGTSYIFCDKDGGIKEIAGLYRDGRRYPSAVRFNSKETEPPCPSLPFTLTTGNPSPWTAPPQESMQPNEWRSISATMVK